MSNNIVDHLEKCGRQNIVQCCFHHDRTGCSFFAVCICWKTNLQFLCDKEKLYVYMTCMCCTYDLEHFMFLWTDINIVFKEIVRVVLPLHLTKPFHNFLACLRVHVHFEWRQAVDRLVQPRYCFALEIFIRRRAYIGDMKSRHA